jgi:predicted membrane protein
MENINSENVKKSLSTKVLLFALVLIGLGMLLLLRNFEKYEDIINPILSWPSIIIAVGILNLNGRTAWFGIILIIFGGLFLAGNYLEINLDFHKIFWPLLIILFGLLIIFLATTNRKRHGYSKGVSSQNKIEEISVFGGAERVITADSFEGGEIINIFGGSKLDLRRSKLAPGDNNIDMVNIFGGSSLLIPAEWDVQVEVVSIFGGFSDKRHSTSIDRDKKLIIKGIAIFGGGEIKTHE